MDIQNLPKESGIYKITNLQNGKIYIGQSKNIYKRFKSYHLIDYKRPEHCTYNTKLYQAFRKYGLDQFSVEVIELCPAEEMDDKEIYWIDFYDSFRHGYNMTEGGQFWTPNIHSPETEEKRKATREKNQSLKGENHPRAKLTNEEVISIRQRYKDGESCTAIHQDYKELYPSLDVFKQIIFGIHYKEVGNVPTKTEVRKGISKFTVEQVNDMRKKYWEDEWTQKAIGELYGIHQSSVKDIVNGKAYKQIPFICEKKRRKNYRFTTDEVREIRDFYIKNPGTPYTVLAEKYHVDPSVIGNCVTRKTYKNIV